MSVVTEVRHIEGGRMKRLILASFASFVVFPVAVLVFGLDTPAQARVPGQVAGSTPDIPRPNPTGSDPKPEDAVAAILAAFDKYEVVGMSAAHSNKDLDDFILGLIRNPALPDKVNDIAVECGNSLYQSVLDRYIAGDDVPLSEARQVWRNTTQPMCGLSSFYEQLFPLVRRINQKLLPVHRMRMLAGDPAVDWSKVRDPKDVPLGVRNESMATVMKKEVLSKHRKALMLIGTFHLLHNASTAGRLPSAVELYEQHYPGLTLVIVEHAGFGNWTALTKYNDEFEARMVSWPIPTLVKTIRGTWLADLLDMTYSPGVIQERLIHGPSGDQRRVVPVVFKGFSKRVDAYLYLGPRDLQLMEPRPAEISDDKDYIAELEKRAKLLGDEPINPEKGVKDYNPFRYDPDFLQRAIKEACESHPKLPCVTPPEVAPE
jgi:hypothetical protein